MILARLSHEGYKELGRAKLLAPTNQDAGRPVLWCHPALANGCVLAERPRARLFRISPVGRRQRQIV